MFGKDHLDVPQSYWENVLWTVEKKEPCIPATEAHPHREAWWKEQRGLMLLCCFRIQTLQNQCIKRFYRRMWRQKFNRFVRVMVQKCNQLQEMFGGGFTAKRGQNIKFKGLLCPACLVSNHSVLSMKFCKVQLFVCSCWSFIYLGSFAISQ